MFKCGVYEKVFTVKSNMLRHTKSHEQIKFQCTHCKKDFTRQSNLADHIQKKTWNVFLFIIIIIKM